MNFVDETYKTESNNQESTLTSIKSSNKKHGEFIQFKKTDVHLFVCMYMYLYIYTYKNIYMYIYMIYLQVLC